MSKHLKEVFASKFHMSLLETIYPESCHNVNTMDIIIEEVNEDGSPWLEECVRFVKVCHSRKECSHYEIIIDPKTGIGRITLSDVQAMKYRLVQVDECGTQMINQDEYEISYMVNDEVQEGDYAEVNFTQIDQHATIHIVNRRMQCATLLIQKSLRKQNGEVCALAEDMEFLVRISRSDGFERFVKLNRENHFACQVCDLRATYTTIEEYEYCDYEPFYRLNDNAETRSTLFALQPGKNEMEIINVERKDTQLTITKYVKDACHEFIKPSCFEEFEIMIVSQEHEESIILCEENDFCATLYGLPTGVYDVFEINSDESMYDTSYLVNEGDESCSASFELCEGDCAEVWVINSFQDKDYLNNQQDSPLRICKYSRGSDGCLNKPDEDCQFKVAIRGCGLDEAFYLNASNNFCMDLASLCVGEYEIKEICEHEFTTSYSINGECEKTSACICYDGSQNFCVAIINEERDHGSIRISKYIRNEFQDLMRPDQSQRFFGTLSSYFSRYCFELNAENDFCVCFDNLRFGSYEVREEECDEYTCSYQVNCEKEKASARFMIDDGCDNEVKIINTVPCPTCGILKIAKFIETASKELVKPTRDEEFEVQVEGDCFHQCYVLRASNNWSIQLEGLAAKEYRIIEGETACYDVCYKVNKEMACDAIVCMGSCNQEVTIINRPHKVGTLRIHALVRTCDNEIIKPDMPIEVLVEGSTTSLQVCLNCDNDYCLEIDELCEGKYRIIQKDTMGYKVSYLVHGKEESFGKIRLGSQDEEVSIINEESACMGNVIVTKYGMDEEGNLFMPCPEEEYHFELKSACFAHTYTLRKRNDFCIYFDDLPEDDYTICELDEGYDVRYRINGGWVENANFTLAKEDVCVDIINVNKPAKALYIEKCIHKGTSFVKPNEDDCFQILIKGKNCHEIYKLNYENDFSLCIYDLACQHYEIKELQTNCKVYYEVDGCRQEDGYILFDGEDIHMRIINEEMFYGCMEIDKKIACEDGRCVQPNRYECFEVMVESDCYKQKVVLNKENDFCVRLYDLPQGHYEINELNENGYVSYLVNDLPYESACVDVCEEDVYVTIVNHPCAKGSLAFMGSMEEDGCSCAMNSEDSICLRVTSEDVCEEIVLKEANDFCVYVGDLLPGNYLVESAQEETLRFEIEGHCFYDEVCIELCGEDVSIQVVRCCKKRGNLTIHKCMMDSKGNLSTPDNKQSYQCILCHDSQEESFILDQHNHFTKVFENRMDGEYEVLEQGETSILLQLEDGKQQEHGCFTIKEQDCNITIINKAESFAWLHVEARIQCCDGHLIKPSDEESFCVHIYGNEIAETRILSAQNAWHEKLYLKEGNYQVVQEESDAYCGLCYLVNDHNVDCAQVNICDEEQFVTTLNLECCAKGSIELCKLIRDEEGCYRYPAKEDEYTINVIGKQDSFQVLLHAKNHFYASLRNLVDGRYEIQEEKGSDNVEYIVNNATSSTRGIVHVEGNVNTVNIINSYHRNTLGSIILNKYVADAQGLLMKPIHGTYRMHISKPGYNEVFYLTSENQYHRIVSDLEEGLYVIDEVDHEGVTYIINGGSQVEHAAVQVMGNENHVDIINASIASGGSITLAKYIREDVQLKRPNGQDSYVFLVSRPGYHQLFTLDHTNQWMLTIEDLEDGEYTVSETTNGAQVSYIINGASEVNHAVVNVQGNSNTVQIINTHNKEEASLTLRKQMRNADGQLVQPQLDFTTRIHVSAPGYNEIVTLHQDNQWTHTLTELPIGLYVVDELDARNQVTYIIDQGSETEHGVVNVNSGQHEAVIINTSSPSTKGSIHIEKYVREKRKLRRPQGDFTTTLYISKSGYQQMFTLDASNEWMIDVINLADGLYVIEEVGNNDTVSYIINGGSEVQNGVVSVEKNANMVMMIDSMGSTHSSIQLEKFIRASDGSLLSPTPKQSFQLQVRGDDQYQKTVILNADNHWNVTLTDLKNGYYEIEETSQQGYSVSYIVDDGLETSNASVRLLDNAHRIRIINSSATTMATLILDKKIRNGDGSLITPADGDTFTIQINNAQTTRRIVLNSGNNFRALLQDLPQGEYRIVEVESLQYVTTYRINGGEEVQIAYVNMEAGNTNHVDIINELLGNRNTIEVFKYMLDNDGNYLPPEAGNVYSFTIRGLENGIVESYELNVDNSWHQRITTLANGVYQVIEDGTSPYPIKYLVNSADLKENAIFTANAGTTQIIGIINTMVNDGLGKLALTKRIRDINGALSIPTNGEIFTLNVSGNGSNFIVTLEPQNNYTFMIEDIAFGVYTVEEVGNDYQVSYQVNGGIETRNGVVNIEGSAVNSVLVINTANPVSSATQANSVHIVLE